MGSSGRVHPIVTVATYLVAFVPFILIAWWLTVALQYPDDPSSGNAAGLALQWNSTTFGTWQLWNWHPMLMTTGFGLLASHAIISFKALPFSHEVKKAIHGITHLGAFTCASVGLAAVVLFKDAKQINQFYSVHAWLGIGAYSLYGLQLLLGVFFFVFPKPSQRIRAAFLPLHTFAGSAIYVCTIMALITGVLDRILITSLTKDPLNPIMRGANFYMITLAFTMFGVMWHARQLKKQDDDVKYTAINTVGGLEYN